MIGKPKYKIGDIVTSDIILENGVKRQFTGTIEIVDRYGTFGQNEHVSYDIMVDDWLGSGTKMFVKHVVEPNIKLIKKDK